VIGGPAATPVGAVNVELRGDEGKSLHVINAQLKGALDVDPETLRSRKLLPYLSPDVRRFEIQTPSVSYQLNRPEGREDEFRLGGSIKEAGVRASRAGVDDVLAALARVEAQSFLAEDVAARASKPEITITLIPKDSSKPSGVLALGGECPDKSDQVIALVTLPNRISACVAKTALEGLHKAPSDLADRRLFLAKIDEIEEITLTSEGKTLELARKGTGFHERAPEDKEIEGDAGRAFLEPLLELRGTKILEGGDKHELGLEPPRGKIKLTSLLPSRGEDGGDDERTEEIFVGAPKDDSLPVQRASDGAILVLPTSAARLLFPNKVALRSLTLVDAPETAITKLFVTEGDRVQSLERTSEGGFKLLEPKGKGLAADIGLGSDLASALFPLKAERFVAEKDNGSFGLDKPRFILRADFGKDKDARSVELSIGAQTTDGSFARLGGDSAVFVIDKKIETASSSWLLDRSIFSFDLGDVVKVSIDYPGGKTKPLVLERSAGALRLTSDPSATSRTAAIRDALADLVPLGAESVGPPRKNQGFDPPAAIVTVQREHLEDPEGTEPPRIDPARTIRISLGAGDSFHGTTITYARRDGVDATYAIPQAKTRPLLEGTGK